MIVVGIYKSNAKNYAGLTIADDWKSFTRRISFYYKNVFEVKEKILNGEVISLPYISLQLDRRKKSVKVKDERRIVREEKQLSGRVRE
ncbi:hypothetical protein ES704_03779 [subsurface metagenome]|jgi:hypothetical protein